MSKKKPQIGDIIEISTPKGLVYGQYTHENKLMGSLIRIFHGFYNEPQNNLKKISETDTKFQIFFPLKEAASQEIVRIVGNEEIPSSYKKFPIFKTGVRDQVTKKIEKWWLWDGDKSWKVGNLTEEQKQYPFRAIWNDTMLIDKITSGWKVTDEV